MPNSARYPTEFDPDKTPHDYHKKLKVIEDPPKMKVQIPTDWERNPLTDRNHYMKSPQFRFSLAHGDFDNRRYQSRFMNRRYKQQDSFTKVIPTYHHMRESSYNNNQS